MNFKLDSNSRNRGPPVNANQESRPTNPFLNFKNGNTAGAGGNNNMFYNNPHQAVVVVAVADETAKAETTAESKEEFPSLVLAASRKVRHRDCSPAANPPTAAISYKASLVSGINTRMLEEQSKMRSAQAAELERRMEVFNEERISSARAARAVLANSDVVTDLDVLYDD
jgi:hypothetical protein